MLTVKLDWKNLTYIPVDFCILSLYSVELSLFEENSFLVLIFVPNAVLISS